MVIKDIYVTWNLKGYLLFLVNMKGLFKKKEEVYSLV
jgi:hypothetical protein